MTENQANGDIAIVLTSRAKKIIPLACLAVPCMIKALHLLDAYREEVPYVVGLLLWLLLHGGTFLVVILLVVIICLLIRNGKRQRSNGGEENASPAPVQTSERLAKLEQLKRDGLITEAEYTEQRKKIISAI